VKAGIEAGMDMSAYLAFDKQGNCVDGGMVYSAHRGMGIDFSAGERLKMKKNLGYAGEEIGWRFGLNSGISFTPPSNPYFKDQREKPLNKNVKIYKPN
jgi:hypothetical protein